MRGGLKIVKKTAPESAKTQKIREKLRKLFLEQDKMISKEALAQMSDQIRFSITAKTRLFAKKESCDPVYTAHDS